MLCSKRLFFPLPWSDIVFTSPKTSIIWIFLMIRRCLSSVMRIGWRRDCPMKRVAMAARFYQSRRGDDRPSGSFRPPPQQQRSDRGGIERSDQRPPRRPPTQFTEENVQKLLELKKSHKQLKSTKERVAQRREARRIVRGVRIDMSSQDEKTIALYLNCAAYFQASMCDGLEDAFTWMRQNIGGLTPQNLALCANALGSIQPNGFEEVLRDEIAPSVYKCLTEMTTVEVVMILQAFQRGRVSECNELQRRMLDQLMPCISTMPASQISTLATALRFHPMKTNDEAAWRSIVSTVVLSIKNVDRMHSNEVITLLLAAAPLDMPVELIGQLLCRATDTAKFHTDEQIKDLLQALRFLKESPVGATDALTSKRSELQTALVVRLERVARFASLRSIVAIWETTPFIGVELPKAIQDDLMQQVRTELTYSRTRPSMLLRLLKSMDAQKLQNKDLVDCVSDLAVGIRPSRPHEEKKREPIPSRGIPDIVYASNLASYMGIRIALEDSYALIDSTAGLPGGITGTLAPHLLTAVSEAWWRQILLAVEAIALSSSDCCYRNTQADQSFITAATARLKSEGAAALEHLSPAFCERFLARVVDAEASKEFVGVLKELVSTRK